MLMSRSKTAEGKTRVLILTADAGFEESARDTFNAAAQIDLQVVGGSLSAPAGKLEVEAATVVVIDLDAAREEEMRALQAFMAKTGSWPPVVVVTQTFDAEVARTLLQMRVADFLVKPVPPIELVRACARVVKAPAGNETKEAQIYTFLPAVGGAGVTTLAIQTAMLLLDNGTRAPSTTCLVDLNFQQG